ncbi:MAG: hypothetical protein ACP5II_01180 [Infirmifilum sp.]|uniref:hypothetical protein n=1 Tax=Infirmifilum TaxID=2856573 RepID=UPI002353663B
MTSPQVNVTVNLKGETILIPLSSEASIKIENHARRRVQVDLNIEKIEWGLEHSILKVEFKDKILYIGSSSPRIQKQSFSLEPGEKSTLQFKVITPPRLAKTSPTTIRLEVNFRNDEEKTLPVIPEPTVPRSKT